MKKKKASATINKVVTCTLLVVVNFTYIALIGVCIFKFGFSTDVKGEYRTVNWQMAATESYDYKLYSDKIPLTCEDLYGDMDYDYYSYEKELNSTFFITKNNYRQDSLPAKDAPPRIEYDIIEPQFDFVYNLSKKHLLEIPEWQNNTSFHTIDNEMFGTMEAYQEYYDDTPTGKYILLFNDKIILLSLEEEATREQIPIIIEKLKI